MFRGFGLQSAGGCSEARGATHTAAQTSIVSRMRIFTALLSFPGSGLAAARPAASACAAVDNSTGTASMQQQKSIIYCRFAELSHFINKDDDGHGARAPRPGGRMDMNRRGFAKSLTGVVGAFVTGPAAAAAAPPP